MKTNNRTLKILLALDTSINLQEITTKLIQFLHLYEVDCIELNLFHNYELPAFSGKHLPNVEAEVVTDEQMYQVEFMTEIRRTIEQKIAEELEKRCEINTILVDGNFSRNIVNQLVLGCYDLLVLVPQERDIFEKFFRKNKVKQLIEEVEIPILILPRTANTLSQDFKLIGLVKSKEGFDFINMLSIFKWAKAERKMLVHFGSDFEGKGVFCIPRLALHSIDETFVKYINQYKGNNFYIIDHQKHKGITDFFSRSFTQNFLKSDSMHMLVI